MKRDEGQTFLFATTVILAYTHARVTEITIT